MCVSDIRLGRWIRSVKTPFNTTGGAVLSVSPNLQRVGIEFHVNIAIATSASWVNVLNEGSGLGILTLNQLIRRYELQYHGDLVQKAWSVTQGSGNITGNVVEYLLDEQTIAAEFNEFRRRL